MPSIPIEKTIIQGRQSVLDPGKPAGIGGSLFHPPSMAASATASNGETGTPVRTIVALTITSVIIVVAIGLFVVWQLHKYQIEEIKRHNSRKLRHQFIDQNLQETLALPKENRSDNRNGLTDEHKDLPDDTKNPRTPIRHPQKETPPAQKKTYPEMIPNREQGRSRRQSHRGDHTERPFEPAAGHVTDHDSFRSPPCSKHMGRYPQPTSFERRASNRYPQQFPSEQQPQGKFPQPKSFEQQPPGPTFPQRMYDSPRRTQRAWGSGNMQYGPRPTMVPGWQNQQGRDPASKGDTRSRRHISPKYFVPPYPAAPHPRSRRYHATTVEDGDSIGA